MIPIELWYVGHAPLKTGTQIELGIVVHLPMETGARLLRKVIVRIEEGHMLIRLVPFLAGIICTWLIPQSILYDRLVCLWISFSYTATWTLSMSVAAANTAGHTKKATTNTILLIGYCLDNFIEPFFLHR